MTKLDYVFDVDAEKIEKVCEDNGISTADIIEALLDHLEEVKDECGWM